MYASKAHRQACLALTGNAHGIYMSLDDSLRRICNQAFFARINIHEVEDTDFVDAQDGELRRVRSRAPGRSTDPRPAATSGVGLLKPDMLPA